MVKRTGAVADVLSFPFDGSHSRFDPSEKESTITDYAKQAAWDRYREQLETLGVDSYSPDVPADDPRYEQVQAIVAEYRGIPQPLFALSESWEGTQPIFVSLDDVAKWLRDEWSIITATRMSSEDGMFPAKKRAMQSLRNAHRILDVLDVDDRPERQPPAGTLEECESQVRQLERWFREKHASGWKPKKTAGGAASSRPTGKRRDEIPDDYEANLRIRKVLETNPRATIRDVRDATGLSVGRIQKLEAWRLEMARRRSEKPKASKEHRQLTNEMLATLGKGDDPAAKVIRDEAIWQWVLEQAPPKQRAELHMKTEAERAEIVELSREAYELEHSTADD